MAVARMKDIARDLGVSIVTVSKVLRNHPDISQATRDRVMQRIKELDYSPNLMARGLVTGRTFLVALIVPDLLHAFFAEIAIVISKQLRKQGYRLLISWSEEDASIEADEVRHLLAHGLDAMIVATSSDSLASFRLLEERDIPYVLLDRDIPELKAPFVGVDDVLMGKMATEHLIEIGCKRIGHIYGPPTSPGQRRMEGYKAALASAGRPLRSEYVLTPSEAGPLSFHHGFEATQRLLAVKPRIDGIFCFNDPLAVGAIEAVLAAGLRIPEDVAIIGCGNFPAGAALRLPLSTMDQNTEELGSRTTKLALSLMQKPAKAAFPRRVILKPRLVIRATTARTVPPKPGKKSGEGSRAMAVLPSRAGLNSIGVR